MQDVIGQPGAEEYWPTKTSFIEQALWEHLKALGVNQHAYLYPEQLPLPSPVPSVGEIGREVAELREIIMQMQQTMGMGPPAPDYSAAHRQPPPTAAAQGFVLNPYVAPDPVLNPVNDIGDIFKADREARARRDEEDEQERLERKEKRLHAKIQRDIDAGRVEFHWYDDNFVMTEAHPDHDEHDPDVVYEPDD